MGSRGIRSVILSFGLLTLLAACQSAPYQRGYVQPARYGGYDPCHDGYGCGPYVRSTQICPPGHRLIRLPNSTFGRPARDCVPVVRTTYRYGRSSGCYDGYDRCCGGRGSGCY